MPDFVYGLFDCRAMYRFAVQKPEKNLFPVWHEGPRTGRSHFLSKDEEHGAVVLEAMQTLRALLYSGHLTAEVVRWPNPSFHISYYTPLPLNLANNKQTCVQASKQHFSFPLWPLLRFNASGSTVL